METLDKKGEVVGFTTLEVVLFLTLLTLLVSGVSLGAGFALGSTHGIDSVVGMCNRMDEIHEARTRAVMVNVDRTEAEVRKYEEFLMRVEADKSVTRRRRIARGGK